MLHPIIKHTSLKLLSMHSLTIDIFLSTKFLVLKTSSWNFFIKFDWWRSLIWYIWNFIVFLYRSCLQFIHAWFTYDETRMYDWILIWMVHVSIVTDCINKLFSLIFCQNSNNGMKWLQTSRPEYNQILVKKPGGPDWWPY